MPMVPSVDQDDDADGQAVEERVGEEEAKRNDRVDAVDEEADREDQTELREEQHEPVVDHPLEGVLVVHHEAGRAGAQSSPEHPDEAGREEALARDGGSADLDATARGVLGPLPGGAGRNRSAPSRLAGSASRLVAIGLVGILVEHCSRVLSVGRPARRSRDKSSDLCHPALPGDPRMLRRTRRHGRSLLRLLGGARQHPEEVGEPVQIGQQPLPREVPLPLERGRATFGAPRDGPGDLEGAETSVSPGTTNSRGITMRASCSARSSSSPTSIGSSTRVDAVLESLTGVGVRRELRGHYEELPLQAKDEVRQVEECLRQRVLMPEPVEQGPHHPERRRPSRRPSRTPRSVGRP